MFYFYLLQIKICVTKRYSDEMWSHLLCIQTYTALLYSLVNNNEGNFYNCINLPIVRWRAATLWRCSSLVESLSDNFLLFVIINILFIIWNPRPFDLKADALTTVPPMPLCTWMAARMSVQWWLTLRVPTTCIDVFGSLLNKHT